MRLKKQRIDYNARTSDDKHTEHEEHMGLQRRTATHSSAITLDRVGISRVDVRDTRAGISGAVRLPSLREWL